MAPGINGGSLAAASLPEDVQHPDGTDSQRGSGFGGSPAWFDAGTSGGDTVEAMAEPSLPAEEDEAPAWERMLAQVRDAGSTRCAVERRSPAHLQGHVETITIDPNDFTIPDLIDHLRRTHGGGVYRLRLYGPKGYRPGATSVRIAGPPIVHERPRPETTPAPANMPSGATMPTVHVHNPQPAPQQPDLIGLIKALGTGHGGDASLLAALVPALVGATDKRDQLLLQLLTQNRGEGSKPSDLVETVKAFKELRGLFGSDGDVDDKPEPSEPDFGDFSKLMPLMMMMGGQQQQPNPMMQMMQMQMMQQMMGQKPGAPMQLPPGMHPSMMAGAMGGYPPMPGYPGMMPGMPGMMPGGYPGMPGMPGPMPGYPAQQPPQQPAQQPPQQQPPQQQPPQRAEQPEEEDEEEELDPTELRKDIGEYLRGASVDEARAFLDGLESEFPPALLQQLAASMGGGQ